VAVPSKFILAQKYLLYITINLHGEFNAYGDLKATVLSVNFHRFHGFLEVNYGMSFVNVASVIDLESNKMKAVNVNGPPILLVNLEGTYYAIENKCTHMQCTFTNGDLKGEVVNAPAKVTLQRQNRQSCGGTSGSCGTQT
jgi:hypothetical protein